MSGHHEGAIQLILFYDPESDWTVLPFLVNGSYLLSEWHWKNWLDGCKKASTTFIKIWTPDSFSNAPSGLEVIVSVVPAARQPGCLPFIPGNVAFLLAFPPQPSFCWSEGRLSFLLLAPANWGGDWVLCLFTLLVNCFLLQVKVPRSLIFMIATHEGSLCLLWFWSTQNLSGFWEIDFSYCEILANLNIGYFISWKKTVKKEKILCPKFTFCECILYLTLMHVHQVCV